MVAVHSTMLPLGTVAPDFRLPDTNGRLITLESLGHPAALLIVFMCNHCPYVKHLAPALAQVARDYAPRGVVTIGINSNDTERYPADSPEQMTREAAHWGYAFPYLVDATQSVAKAYHAACTPDFFLFGPDHKLVYRGQFDDSRPGNGLPVTGQDLRAALEALLAGQPVASPQKPSIGCNIKWKPQNEPDWFR